MKKRTVESEASLARAEESLCRALLSLDTVSAMRAFLHDLCTPSELEALIDRWRVVPFILEGLPYREIHERTAVSITTIGRVARFLSQGNGGYLAALSKGESEKSVEAKADKRKSARSLPWGAR